MTKSKFQNKSKHQILETGLTLSMLVSMLEGRASSLDKQVSIPASTTINKLLKQCFIILILSSVFHFCFDICHSVFAQDKIIAVVNADIITQKDLNDFINFMRIQLSIEYKGEELESRVQSIKLDLLDKLIEDRLIFQEAKKAGISIDSSKINAKIAQIKKRYPSEAEFTTALKSQGLVQADLEEKIKEQLLMHSIIDIKIRKKININPTEVTNFYNENPKEFNLPQERHVVSAAFETELQAKEIFLKLNQGDDLEDLAKKNSLQISRLAAVRDGRLKPDIEEIIFNLSLKAVSEPLKIEDRYYIFKLENIIESRQESLAEAQDKIYAFLTDKKMQEELTRWLDELKKNSYIKITEQ